MSQECLKNRQSLAADFKKFQKVFTALGDENRQQIILTLLGNEKNGMRVMEIAEKYHLSRPAVSHHLKILKDSGLVDVYHVGKRNYYFLNPDPSLWQELELFSGKVDALIRYACNCGYPAWEELNHD